MPRGSDFSGIKESKTFAVKMEENNWVYEVMASSTNSKQFEGNLTSSAEVLEAQKDAEKAFRDSKKAKFKRTARQEPWMILTGVFLTLWNMRNRKSKDKHNPKRRKVCLYLGHLQNPFVCHLTL